MRRSRSSLLAFSLLMSCRGEAASVPDAGLPLAPARPEEHAEKAPTIATTQPVDAAANALPQAVAVRSQGPAPRRGCTIQQTRTLREGAAEVRVAGSLALVLLSDRTTLELWTTGESEPRKLSEQRTGAKVDSFTLIADRQVTMMAWISSPGVLSLQPVVGGAFGKPVRVAEGVDGRFAPALLHQGASTFVAYTRSVDDVMHVFLARVSADKVGESADLTPPGHGATAATFVLGAPSTLVMIDARAGVSPLLEVPIVNGKAQPAIVRTPVSQPYAPPLLRAVALPKQGAVEVAFTALGKLAATAIGRVPLRQAVAPLALHPSRGYGQLSFDAALTRNGVVFALEEPVDETPQAAHQIELKWLDDQGEGQALPIHQGQLSARFPSLARLSQEGELALAFIAGNAARWLRVSCD